MIDTRERLVILLDEHRSTSVTGDGPRKMKRVCSCGETIGQLPYPTVTGVQFRLGGDPFDEPHRLHIAEVLAEENP